MRLFVALDVADDVCAQLDRALAPVRERYDPLRWTRPEGWHVTLAFLGEVDEDDLGQVESVVRDGLAGLSGGPVGLALDEPGRFGQRAAWIGLADRPRGAVAALGTGVQEALERARLPVDRREVRPHLTVARPRGRRGRLPAGLVDDLPLVEASWRVGEAVLYRSHLGPQGARYEALASLPL